MTARFEMTSPVGQRCILQYMLPWIANIELVDLSNASPTPPELNIETDEEEQTGVLSSVELDGEGWGSLEATQLVLNNLFYITVKVNPDCYCSEDLICRQIPYLAMLALCALNATLCSGLDSTKSLDSTMLLS